MAASGSPKPNLHEADAEVPHEIEVEVESGSGLNLPPVAIDDLFPGANRGLARKHESAVADSKPLQGFACRWRQRDGARLVRLGQVDLAFVESPLDVDAPTLQVDVRPFECVQLPRPHGGVR